jgi:hypothetical protein
MNTGKVRLLSDQERSSLLGDLRGLGLPPSVRLYMAAGLPQMFHSMAMPGEKPSRADWLYVPHSQVCSLRQAVQVECSSPRRIGVSRHAVQTDDYKLYPAIYHGELAVFLALRHEEAWQLTDNLRAALMERLAARLRPDAGSEDHVPGTFVRQLFRCDQSMELFLKSALSLLAAQWPRCMAALYYASDGGYLLRMAAGEIRYGDALPREVGPVGSREWTDAIRRQQYFLPAELLPNYPVMLDTPPLFLFVHPAIASELTEYLLAVVVTGDITRPAAAGIHRFAQLIAGIHQSQFSTAGDLLAQYALLNDMVHSSLPLDETLKSLYTMIARHVDVTRLLFTTLDGPATVIRPRRAEEPIASVHPLPSVPSECFGEHGKDRFLFVRDCKDKYRGSEWSERYEHDRVASELTFPINLPDRAAAVLAIGSTQEGEHLLDSLDFLEAAAKYLEVYLYVAGKSGDTGNAVKGHRQLPSESGEWGRLRITSRLADGLLHSLLEQLSIVLGQSEIMQDEMHTQAPGETSETLLSGSERIASAAGVIADYVGHLRWLLVRAPGQETPPITAASLNEDLPALLSGCSRSLQAAKRININFESRIPIDSPVTLSHDDVVEIVLPLLVTIMEETICSGRIVMTAEPAVGGNVLMFSCDRRLIEHLSIVDLLGRIYPDHRVEVPGMDAGRVRIGNAILQYRVDSDSCHLRFQFGRDSELMSKTSARGLQESAG